MRFETKPLPAVWPTGPRTPAAERRKSQFTAPWGRTMEQLEYELRMLEAAEPIILEAGYQPHELRLDGFPRKGARPTDPAVIISFSSRVGPLRYACDTFLTHEDNLRALALSLQALRAVDRYGAARGEQYQGWAALPVQAGMTTHEAESFIREHGGYGGELRAAYHIAARHLYPKNGADHGPWDRLQLAKEALGL